MPEMPSIGLNLSLRQKCPLVAMAGGLTLLVAGGVFFLISVGLTKSMWVLLGKNMDRISAMLNEEMTIIMDDNIIIMNLLYHTNRT